MELQGKIKVIFEEKTFNGGFTKREFVLTTEEQYPQMIIMEMHKERAAVLNTIKSGDQVKVSFDVRGREWQDKYFNSLVAWKIEPLAAGTPAPQDMPPPPTPVDTIDDPIEDDLPF